jgi:hypothetical protein
MALDVKCLVGEEMKAVLPDLARLRIIVFRDWPYLYDGTLEYEQEYLAKLAAATGAVCVIARDGIPDTTEFARARRRARSKTRSRP